ncbi:MAG: dTDP-4-amino-4,6-dideoxygalactose transaminase [Chitinophagales bacterium]
MRIPFFKTAITGKEQVYVQEVLSSGDSFANKCFVAKCENWFTEHHQLEHFFLTKSCSDALELATLLLNIQSGDEVIMPSYAFVACSNAVALRGGTCVFIDIHPDTMNLDETKLEAAITARTKAILTINYAGVSCNYPVIKEIAQRYNITVIEDNAHGTGAKIGNNALGTFGDISTFSFDHLKNISCGQGGGIAINNLKLLEHFYVPYEFGTNRRSFFKGEANRYEWKSTGSNYPLSELNAAMLYAQLENCEKINGQFIQLWNLYYEQLKPLETNHHILLPRVDSSIKHNAHCFFIKTKTEAERNQLVEALKEKGIHAQFHYSPLHSSEFGLKSGRFHGMDEYTTSESKRLLRLPLFYGLSANEVIEVSNAIRDFYL